MWCSLFREKKAQREDREAQRLGQDYDGRKAPPKALKVATPTSKDSDTPPVEKGSATPPLTKAQIKRRKKKALASVSSQEEVGVDVGVASKQEDKENSAGTGNEMVGVVKSDDKPTFSSPKSVGVALSSSSSDSVTRSDSTPSVASSEGAVKFDPAFRPTSSASVGMARYNRASSSPVKYAENIIHHLKSLRDSVKLIAVPPRAPPPSQKAEWEEGCVSLLSEQEKMEEVLIKAALSDPATANLADKDKVEMLKDLAALSYPVVGDLLESVNSLAMSLDSVDPHAPVMVSVLVDPFCVYDGGTNPRTGAIAFVKRKNKVRPPMPIRPRSAPFGNPFPGEGEPPRQPASPSSILPPSLVCRSDCKEDAPPSRLAKIMADAINSGLHEDLDEQQSIDYTFVSLESMHLPGRLKRVAESRERGAELEALLVSKEEYRQVMVAVKKYGESHAKIRHRDTESMLFFPSQLKLLEEEATPTSARGEGPAVKARAAVVVGMENVKGGVGKEESAAKVILCEVWVGVSVNYSALYGTKFSRHSLYYFRGLGESTEFQLQIFA